MNEYLKCPKCKKTFHEEDTVVKCISRQTLEEPAEYQGYCPHCGAYEDDCEICEICECCGEGFVDVEMVETELGLYCPECAFENVGEVI